MTIPPSLPSGWSCISIDLIVCQSKNLKIPVLENREIKYSIGIQKKKKKYTSIHHFYYISFQVCLKSEKVIFICTSSMQTLFTLFYSLFYDNCIKYFITVSTEADPDPSVYMKYFIRTNSETKNIFIQSKQ